MGLESVVKCNTYLKEASLECTDPFTAPVLLPSATRFISGPLNARKNK